MCGFRQCKRIIVLFRHNKTGNRRKKKRTDEQADKRAARQGGPVLDYCGRRVRKENKAPGISFEQNVASECSHTTCLCDLAQSSYPLLGINMFASSVQWHFYFAFNVGQTRPRLIVFEDLFFRERNSRLVPSPRTPRASVPLLGTNNSGTSLTQ